ncbi:MAG: HAD family hydrolase [Candidatus Gastranaerophilales bacterium]|nr:HAD family hydrolase [Candidatus Gastranaerophilales bacterium]
MKTVFLDFDGVLFDTLREAFVLCRYAYSNIDIFEPIDEHFYKLFYRYKFLVYNSWQYYYLMKVLTNNHNKTDSDIISEYKNFLENRDTKSEEHFDEIYLKTRIELMNNHTEYWNSLETPFPFFENIKKLYAENLINPIIVSKKNKFAIRHRMAQYGLELDNNKIFAKEELLPYNSKADFMAEYMRKKHLETAFFVDDNSNNLRPCEKYQQIKPFLANWGNIGINEKGYSYEEIIQTIESAS